MPKRTKKTVTLPQRAKEERTIIRTIRLRKVYGEGDGATVALDDIDLEVRSGEFLCLMGPSGCGKTTLFRMIGGLESPTSGNVLIDEVDVAQLSAVELAFLRCRKIGYIFQHYELILSMTALENVTIPMTFAGISSDAARGRGIELLELVGLGERWQHRPAELSGGQQQRVAIARALANNPGILLCDEPTANLDFRTGREILSLLQRINREQHVTLICATHDYRMLDLSDRLLWLRDGKVERIANRSDVKVELAGLGAEG